MLADDQAAPAISISGLTKDFSLGWKGMKLRAVDHLTLRIANNQIFGLLGPNGSGKSTTIKVLLGLLEPTAGTCSVFGIPSRQMSSRVDLGYLPEAPYFYRYLTGRELVSYFARLCGVSKGRLRERVNEVIAWVGLSDAASRRVGTYSKGMLQRIGLAQALVHDPKLIILDEPTAGVDPVGSAEMARLILELKQQGKTILLCSHLLAQVEQICDRVAILDRGRLIVEGSVKDLTREQHRHQLVVDGWHPSREESVRKALAREGVNLCSVEEPETTLDQVFLDKVGYLRDSTKGTRQLEDSIDA